ncbi:MAG: hypothetical protein KDE46_28540, partial [Caldilineaceae bacterium]|nr:hypothetical protein [Caldilineaceae bacterium]
MQSGQVYVKVCYSDTSCSSTNNFPGSDPQITLDAYVKQVLANEWPSNAGLEAMKAGAIAIRTFAYRSPGCGAYKGSLTVSNGPPPIVARVLDNRSQAYKIGGQGGSQNPVNSNHDNANTQTSLLYLYRNDNAFACAKYNADVGNPTAACTSGCSSDTNDQNMLSAIADPVSKTATPNALGMGQNGTAAWTLGGVPWNYRQILAHYYKQAKIGSSDNNAYRWTWLNVGSTVAFTGLSGREYYSPKANTPTLMGAGLTYNVPMYIQNTGSSTWNSPYLSYRWYNSANSDVTNSDQILNFLIGSVSPSAAVPSFNASMRGYGQPGTYTVKWDMNQSGTWFSQQNNWPTQNISVQVVPSLNQTLWRGNQAWTRNVLIINGSIDWTTASTWSGPIGLTGIPGSGALRTWTNFRVGNTMIQGYWRGDAEAAQEGRT